MSDVNLRENRVTEEQHDPVTGEVPSKQGEVTTDEPKRERAADGQIVPATAYSAGAFVDLLEDGAYSRDVHAELRNLLATMTAINNATGQKIKGKLTLVIDVMKDGEAFTMQGKVTVKEPEMPRPKSIMWADETGNPCRFPPNQTQMFGIAARPLRNI
jgi:hypothetical protein